MLSLSCVFGTCGVRSGVEPAAGLTALISPSVETPKTHRLCGRQRGSFLESRLSVGEEQMHWDQLLETSDGSPPSIRPSCVVARQGETTNLMQSGVLQKGLWGFRARACVSISPCATRNIPLPKLAREVSHCPQCCKAELQMTVKYPS